MLQRAVEGSRRLGLDDVADEYEEMSVEDYADRKGLVLTNPAPVLSATPKPQRRSKTMALEINDTRTKDQIRENEENLLTLLDDIWNELVDIDDDSSAEDAREAAAAACELMNDFDPERFPFDEEDDQEQGEAA
jgi:hypothetical protein